MKKFLLVIVTDNDYILKNYSTMKEINDELRSMGLKNKNGWQGNVQTFLFEQIGELTKQDKPEDVKV